MELVGTVIDVLKEESGQSAKGTWRKQSYVIETQGQYPKKVCAQVWGDKIDSFGLKEGANVTASIEVESREFNGRWYTDVRIWKVTSNGGATAAPKNIDIPLPSEPPLVESDDDDTGLPF